MDNSRKKYTFRKFMNDIHLWLGIGSGIILFIICLTGTIYVFAKDITEWIDNEKYTVPVSGQAQTIPLTQLVTSIEKDKKDCKVTNVQIPEGKERAWLFTLTPKDILARRSKEENEAKQNAKRGAKTEGRENRGGREKKTGKEKSSGKNQRTEKREQRKGMSDRERIKTYLVNPYTGQIQGDTKTSSSQFFMTIMGLHRWLLLDHSVGRFITGTATILFIILELTGLILWLPAKIKSWKKWNSWKAGFKIKTDARWKRINHDLHNTLGFYTFLLITLMALTGICFSFEWVRNGVEVIFGAKPFSDRRGIAIQSKFTGKKPQELDVIISKANEVLPYKGDIRLTLPKDSVSAVTVNKIHTGFISSAGTDRIFIDQYTGSILKIDYFSNKKIGEQIVALIYPLHVGEVFGTFTKIIYFIACLIATSLPITGTIIWINKLRKKSPKEDKEVSPAKKIKPNAVKPSIPKVKIPVLKPELKENN